MSLSACIFIFFINALNQNSRVYSGNSLKIDLPCVVVQTIFHVSHFARIHVVNKFDPI